MYTEDPKSDDSEDKVHRLVDLLVHEVSLVDSGANRHKWLIRKREDNMKGKKVSISEDGSLTTKNDPFGVADAAAVSGDNSSDNDDTDRDDTKKMVKIAKTAKDSVSTVTASAKEAISVIVDAVKSADEDKEKGATIPAVISGPISNITSAFLSLMTDFPTQKAMTPDVHVVEADDKFRVEGVDTGSLFGEYDSKDDAEKRADEVAAFKPSVTKRYDSGEKATKAREILWAVIDEINDGAFAEESDKNLIEAMLGMLKGAVEKQAEELAQLVISPDAKTDITKTLKGVSSEIDTFIASIEKAEETEDELPAPMPDELGLELAKIAHSMVGLATKYSASEESREDDKSSDDVAKVLASVIGKLSVDKSDEAPAIKLLTKAADLLGGSQQSDDKGSGEQDYVDKRGAKLSAARRAKFREAMKILSDLFTELVPDGDKGTWPHRNSAKSKAEIEITELEKRQAEVEAKVKKSEAELRNVRKDLAKEKKRAQPSNAVWVDQVPDEENFDKVNKTNKVAWPADLNSPVDW